MTQNERTITRIDGAHRRPSDEGIDLTQSVSLDEVIGFTTNKYQAAKHQGQAGSVEIESERLQRQAHQIRSQLFLQQQDVDRREAETNARLARIENEARTVRLLQAQREQELAERESTFQQRWDALQQRARAADSIVAQDDRESAQIVRRDPDPVDRERPPHAWGLESAINLPHGGSQMGNSLDLWEKRLSELESSEHHLQCQLDELEAIREQLDVDRENFHQEQTRHTEEFRLQQDDFQEQRQSEMARLQEESAEIESRRIALQQLHRDVTQMYRETLQTRICCEEVWGRMTVSIPPEILTARLAEMRRKLAGQFQLAHQSLANQHAELAELVARLEGHRGNISQERENMERWLTRRRTELDEQASRLAQREQELVAQNAVYEKLGRSCGNQPGSITTELLGQLQGAELPLGESCSVS